MHDFFLLGGGAPGSTDNLWGHVSPSSPLEFPPP